jgi:hypothetical protein
MGADELVAGVEALADMAADVAADSAAEPVAMSRTVSLVWTLILLTVSFVAFCVVLLYIYQDRLLYYPTMPGISKLPETNPKGYRSPLEHKLPFEDMYIKTEDDVVLHAWLILHKPDPKLHPTVSIRRNSLKKGIHQHCSIHLFASVADHIFSWECRQRWLPSPQR